VPTLHDVDFILEYPYTRTTGPVIGPFLTGLRDGRILGQRCGARVLCPPMEFDPDTCATLAPDLVEVGPGGEVVNWTWVAEPSAKHPFDRPFGFAFIKLDGADTALVHAVDTGGDAAAMGVGMRVKAQFRDERHGSIADVYFVPEADAADQAIEPGEEPDHHRAPHQPADTRAAVPPPGPIRPGAARRQDHRPAQPGHRQGVCAR